MNRQAEQRHGILSGLNWKWIPLEAVALNLGLNVSLNLWLRITERLLYLSVAFLAGVLLLSTLISWRLILRFEEVPSLRVSHGILLGIVANVFYLGWTVMTAPEGSGFAVTFESFLGSASLVLGCLTGGFLAGRQYGDAQSR